MGAGVGESFVLGGEALGAMVLVGTAGKGGGVVYVKVDKNVGGGYFLPHVGHVGMFLGGVADVGVPGRVQSVAQGAFAGGAGADDGDAEVVVGIGRRR